MSTAPPTNHQWLNPLAVLRRAKNVKYADEKDRDALLADAESIEDFCAWLVIGGIILEAIVAISPLTLGWERLGSLVADAAVGLGVYGEFRFGHIIGDILKFRLAEATGRAALAQLETERLKKHAAWRSVSVEAARILGDALKTMVPASARFEHVLSDHEAQYFARELATVFWNNGWRTAITAGSYASTVPYWLRIPINPPREGADLAMGVRRAFDAAGVRYGPGEPPEAGGYITEIGDDLVEPIVVIFVGPKGPIQE